MAGQDKTTVFRKPIPRGVAEVRDINADGGIVELRDGSWMLAQGAGIHDSALTKAQYRLSTDGGRSWTAPEPLGTEIGIGGLIRLQSGALAVYGRKTSEGAGQWEYYFSKSMDEGKNWSRPALICDYPNFCPMFHSMIQLKSGRLLLTGYWEAMDSWEFRNDTMVSVHPDLRYLDVSAYGTWRGQRYQVEGHGHAPEMGMTMVYRSDDEGETWTRHPGALMGWFDFEGVVNGYCGQTGCYEPTIAETKDGNVLVVMRSTVGRLVQSVSTDGGESWYSVKPTDLPSSESPALMVTLPGTEDLLIVWNQVSREEIRCGYRRGRLSSAISKDGGHSWDCFKTIEVSDGLEDVDRIAPEYPIQMVRARDFVGVLPDGWAWFNYPNLDVVGDKVVLRYSRGTPLLGIAEQNLNAHEILMRVYPIRWFYEDKT